MKYSKHTFLLNIGTKILPSNYSSQTVNEVNIFYKTLKSKYLRIVDDGYLLRYS